jgi:uncharacterized protein
MRQQLSVREARLIALAAQGFAGSARRKSAPGIQQATATARRLGVIQIDAVNIVARAHLMPLYSRIGPYDPLLLDRLTGESPRRLVEAWAHEASYIPVETWPLLHWRREAARAPLWHVTAAALDRNPGIVAHLCELIRNVGPVTAKEAHTALVASNHASNTTTPVWTGWGNWSDAKAVLEHLFRIGVVIPAGRTPQFERRFDLTERVIPAAVRNAPPPTEADAIRKLVEISAAALGVGSKRDLADYFRLKRGHAKAIVNDAIADLVDAGTLTEVTIRFDGGSFAEPWYLHRDAKSPRAISRCALLNPFDPLVFERSRLNELFDIDYRIEIYTPAVKRVHGYYVLLFLDGDRITARVDLKADRKASSLLVKAAHLESVVPFRDAGGVAERLAAELTRMAAWLDLADVTVEPIGDLAPALAAAIRR